MIFTFFKSQRHSGQMLIMFALMSVVLVGMVGLAIDVGNLLSERRSTQKAADAAAMAGGKVLARTAPHDNDAAEDAARTYATANGYSSGSNVTVDASSGSNRITVTITRDVPSFFIGAVYGGPWQVSSKAVARVTNLSSPFAMIALGQNDNGVIMQGNGTINISGGSVGSNSNITFNGDSVQGAIDGNFAAYGTVGEVPSLLTTTGWAAGNQGLIADPLAGTLPPDCSALPNIPVGSIMDDPWVPGGKILTPGKYNSGVTGKHFSLLPGVYCFSGQVKVNPDGSAGGMMRSVDADYLTTGSVGSGGGVMLYFYSGGSLKLTSANFKVNALGLLGNSYAGCSDACDKNIVVWMANPDCNDFAVNANRTNEIVGVIYAPCSSVDLGGTNNTAVLTGMVIGHDIRIRGDATFNLVTDFDDDGAIPMVYLIE